MISNQLVESIRKTRVRHTPTRTPLHVRDEFLARVRQQRGEPAATLGGLEVTGFGSGHGIRTDENR